jgi:hypothetical protein
VRFGKVNKYKVAPKEDRTWSGTTYASKAEMYYAQDLSRDQSVLVWSRGTRIMLDCIAYVPDFRVTFRDGSSCWVDVKGMLTPVFRLKLKLWQKHGPGELRLYKRLVRVSGHGWKHLGSYGPGLPVVKRATKKRRKSAA